MCKFDFKAIFAAIVRFRESIPNRNTFRKNSSYQNFRKFGVCKLQYIF